MSGFSVVDALAVSWYACSPMCWGPKSTITYAVWVAFARTSFGGFVFFFSARLTKVNLSERKSSRRRTETVNCGVLGLPLFLSPGLVAAPKRVSRST